MIYIWGIADNIGTAITIIAIVGLVLAGILLAVSGIAKIESAEDETVSALNAGFKKALTAGLVALIVAALLPSSNTVAAMVVIPELANSDVIKRDLPDIYAAAIGKLKSEIGMQEAEESK
jgi:Na+/phosphate symporter